MHISFRLKLKCTVYSEWHNIVVIVLFSFTLSLIAPMYWDHKIYVEMNLLSKHWEGNNINKSELYVCFDNGRLLSSTSITFRYIRTKARYRNGQCILWAALGSRNYKGSVTKYLDFLMQ